MAVNCLVVPIAVLEFDGLTAMDRRSGAGSVTDRVVEPETFPDAAVIVVIPATKAVAVPLEPAVLLMEATDVTDELQVTDVVRFSVLLSE